MPPCPKCGGPMGKSSPEHIEIECLKCGWMPGVDALLDKTPTHPTIFGDLRLNQLHITGATYETIGDAPSFPTRIIIGNKGRRWELLIRDAFETDKHGKRLGPGPASTPPTPSTATEKELVLENRITILKAQLATEVKERQLLYPVIDEMKRVRAGLETRIKELELGREEWIKSNERKTRAIDELEADVERLQSLGPIIADREAAIKAFEKENAKLRLQEKQNQAEICAACRKAAEDSANGVPLPPEPDEDRIRELQDKRREDQERRHDAARQHAAEDS